MIMSISAKQNNKHGSKLNCITSRIARVYTRCAYACAVIVAAATVLPLDTYCRFNSVLPLDSIDIWFTRYRREYYYWLTVRRVYS